jgi:glycosyltransferase involved in cell wall biosynthesis
MVRPLAPLNPATRPRGPVRVGVVADFVAEGWPSMDLAAELTVRAVADQSFAPVYPRLIRPPMPRLARWIPGGGGLALNADRFVGRYLAYPAWLRLAARRADLYHVIDHSYAHLVAYLPPGRCVVTCHDLDAFRSLLGAERRSWLFRRTMRRVAAGLDAAAAVICDSEAVRDALEEAGLVHPQRLAVVPLPLHPDFAADADPLAAAAARALLGGPADAPLLLHVGSDAPRKRIPFLLETFAALRRRHPALRLVRVGGSLEPHAELVTQLEIGDAVQALPFLERPVLAALYRRASAVLLPSEREGFGWPLLEAMACGTPVVVSDLPTLRALGGEAADYAAVGALQPWVEAVDRVLRDRADAREARGRREAGLERAAAHSLRSYALRLLKVYRRVLRRDGG